MLSPDDWSRLDALLDTAFDLPPGERAAWLDAQDLTPDLRAQAEALLAADADTAMLDDPGRLGALIDDAGATAQDVPPGTEIGPYRVIRELGRGGMGTVVLAERADGAFEKQVALKLVRPGLADGLLDRFRAERRILARLEHPGIARLLDGGRTADGRPFLAMEFVDGEPLTAYADRRRLDVDARLALFGQVCSAVAYAHRQLVVHRDLKPGNILVAESASGAPTVKLLDFGIAKLLDDDGVQTATDQRLLTPAYAAPEQVRGEPPTTATDVYALGVLLYELLTGRRPYRLPSKARQAVERAILHDEPTRPSAAVTEPDADGDTTAASITMARRTETSRLRRRLAGDLDQIVLAALRKEPERRYAGASALGDDIRRHLGGLPVEAQPDSARYRIGRFVTRHRAGVAAAAFALLALVGGLGAAVWQAGVAADERDRAVLARDEAEGVATLMADLFEQASPRVAQGRDVTARDVLDAGATAIRDDLERHPATRAALLLQIGRAYVNMGLYAEADTLLGQALAIRQDLADASGGDRDAALALAEAHYHLGAARDVLDDSDAAERHYVAAVNGYRAALGGRDDRRLAEALADLGTLRAWSRGDADAAVPLLVESRAAYSRLYAARPDDRELWDMVAYSTGSLGIVRQEQGDSTAAEALYREAVAFLDARGADGSPTRLDNQYMLASLLTETGRGDEAEAVFREIVPAERRILGADHPAHASTLVTLAKLLGQRGKHAEAAETLGRAVEIRVAALGPDHHNTLGTRHLLGRAQRDAGDVPQARATLSATAAACRRTAVCADPDTRGADFMDRLLEDLAAM